MSGDLPPPDPSQRNLYGPDGPYSPEQPPSYDRLRRVLIAVGGLVMVIFAIGLGFIVLRDNGSGPSSSPTGTAPQAESGSVTSTAHPATSTAPPASAAATTAVVTVPATAASPTTAAASATTAAPVTTAAPTSPATAPPATAPSEEAKALATAQALLDALANGQWSAARTLNPGRNESDAFLQNAYGPMEQATIVPAAVKPLSADRFDMRIGIVSHEAQPAGQQTVLLCSHWQVDAATRTVVRLASTRLRVEGGYVDPSTVSGELTSTCATVPLG